MKYYLARHVCLVMLHTGFKVRVVFGMFSMVLIDDMGIL